MKSKITIIVPIYNVEKYVKKCLDSLLKQTFQEYEIWAISDGSPDNSEKIVKDFQKKDKRIKLFKKQNGGYGSVLKYAIERIETKYFIICDPDDWLKSTALEELYQYAEKNRLDITIGDKYNIYSSNGEKEYVSTFEQCPNIKPLKIYTKNDEIARMSFGYVSPHAKLYRTEVAKKIDFPSYVSYTDFILYIMALTRSKRVSYYNKPLAYYLLDRPGNTATDTRTSKVKDYLIGCRYVLNQLRQNDLNKMGLYLFRVYAQYRYALHQYALVSKNPLKDKYISDLYAFIPELRKYKKYMSPYINTIKNKIIFNGVMNRYLYKITLAVIIKNNKVKKI